MYSTFVALYYSLVQSSPVQSLSRSCLLTSLLGAPRARAVQLPKLSEYVWSQTEYRGTFALHTSCSYDLASLLLTTNTLITTTYLLSPNTFHRYRTHTYMRHCQAQDTGRRKSTVNNPFKSAPGSGIYNCLIVLDAVRQIFSWGGKQHPTPTAHN